MLLLPEKEEHFVTGHRLQVLFMCLALAPNHFQHIVRRRKSFNFLKFNSLDNYSEYEIASAWTRKILI